ncbi:NAD-dependent protein deacetylase sirtuin-1-like [Bradysia coprophila]|uniref:NAD-dependent protein deacetylase sirtuin-1-like n=1 Tax=Bradysia coprophila TaxID=38358 RepID=UPI00187D7D8C|nr:NAD-dependent protein deacetylase sirtuin-1-like [Bradysia coprophila]
MTEGYKDLYEMGILKPDIVFFGESLPEMFHPAINADRQQCDCLLVIGSSLKVRPVSLIPEFLNGTVPQILNRERVGNYVFDVELLGDADVIVNQICRMIGGDWTEIFEQQINGNRVEYSCNDQDDGLVLSAMLTALVELGSKVFCIPPDLMEDDDGESKQNEGKRGEGFGLDDGTGENDVSDKIESEDQLDTDKKSGDEKQSKDEEDADCKEERGIDMSDSKLQDVDKKGDDLSRINYRWIEWCHKKRVSGVNPRAILRKIFRNGEFPVPQGVSDRELWARISTFVTQPAVRTRLPDINSIEHVIHLLSTCKNIIVLTGAGVSVSCGIPDFRSRSGIYSRLRSEMPEIDDPHEIFDIRFFSKDPRPFFKFAKELRDSVRLI